MFPGQRSGVVNRKLVQQTETSVSEKGRPEERAAAVPPEADRRAPAQARDAVPNRRHHVLLRLRADAPAPAHSRRGQVLRGLRHTQRADVTMALHVSTHHCNHLTENLEGIFCIYTRREFFLNMFLGCIRILEQFVTEERLTQGKTLSSPLFNIRSISKETKEKNKEITETCG